MTTGQDAPALLSARPDVGEVRASVTPREDSTMPLHEKGTVLTYGLRGHGRGVLQEVAIDGSEHTVRVEGPAAFGGTDSAPSPLDYALAALVSCNQVTSKIVALGQGVELGAFDARVEAEWDNSVLVFGAEGNPNFSSLHLSVEIETNLDDEAFNAFVDEVNRRCPITQLFRRAGVAVTSSWTNKVPASV